MYAAINGNIPCLKLLLPVSDALATDNDGWTTLMYAATGGNASCLELSLPVSDMLAKDKASLTGRRSWMHEV